VVKQDFNKLDMILNMHRQLSERNTINILNFFKITTVQRDFNKLAMILNMNRWLSEINAIDILNLSKFVEGISIFSVRISAYVLISKWLLSNWW